MHQPVDWYEWGEEAFARARAEDKPILLDIGAVWCHWCHVIDRESYENPQLAALINQLFIPVKVDRDERPDVDARYQAAISADFRAGRLAAHRISSSRRPPVFRRHLFPSRRRHGPARFPPHSRSGRRRIIATRRAEVEEAAGALAEAVAQAETFTGARGAFDPRAVEACSSPSCIDSTRATEDSAARRNFRIRGHRSASRPVSIGRQGGPQLLAVAATTLEKMGRGGVYDQIAGGFHRYSVDERWCVPHFEKMSYDNSELLKNFLHGYQVTREPLFREVAEGIIDWTNDVLSDQSSAAAFTPARMPTRPSTTTATISPGRWKKCAPS